VGRDHSVVLGKHSGTHAVQRAYAALAVSLDRDQAERILQQIRSYVTCVKRPPGEHELLEFYHDLCVHEGQVVCL
jgi:homocitrate synthase NifV